MVFNNGRRRFLNPVREPDRRIKNKMMADLRDRYEICRRTRVFCEGKAARHCACSYIELTLPYLAHAEQNLTYHLKLFHFAKGAQ